MSDYLLWLAPYSAESTIIYLYCFKLVSLLSSLLILHFKPCVLSPFNYTFCFFFFQCIFFFLLLAVLQLFLYLFYFVYFCFLYTAMKKIVFPLRFSSFVFLFSIDFSSCNARFCGFCHRFNSIRLEPLILRRFPVFTFSKTPFFRTFCRHLLYISLHFTPFFLYFTKSAPFLPFGGIGLFETMEALIRIG